MFASADIDLQLVVSQLEYDWMETETVVSLRLFRVFLLLKSVQPELNDIISGRGQILVLNDPHGHLSWGVCRCH